MRLALKALRLTPYKPSVVGFPTASLCQHRPPYPQQLRKTSEAGMLSIGQTLANRLHFPSGGSGQAPAGRYVA